VRRVKIVDSIIGVALIASIVWLAGEQHRENCIRANRSECSVLPWNAGKVVRKPSWVEQFGR
jgi:hypothetical protein